MLARGGKTEEAGATKVPNEIEVSSPKTGRKVKLVKSPGDNLADAGKRWGEDVVFSHFKAAFVIRVQHVVRKYLNAMKEDGTPLYTEEEAIQAGLNYVPILAAERVSKKDPLVLLAAKVESGEMTEAELIAKLRDAIKKKEG